MSEFVINPHARQLAETARDPLFMWRGAGIVLFGELDNGRWVLARGWLQGDRLEHIRRWSFAEPMRFSGQVRRLIADASGDIADARAQGQRALAWAEAVH
jgi:hypothetical protein